MITVCYTMQNTHRLHREAYILIDGIPKFSKTLVFIIKIRFEELKKAMLHAQAANPASTTSSRRSNSVDGGTLVDPVTLGFKKATTRNEVFNLNMLLSQENVFDAVVSFHVKDIFECFAHSFLLCFCSFAHSCFKIHYTEAMDLLELRGLRG